MSARQAGVATALVLALALVPAALAAPALSGIVPRGQSPVGSLALPEVHAGRPDRLFHFQAAAGHALFVYFGYTTCPDLCPTTLSDLKRALRGLGDEARRVDVAFVTVDPQRDVPRVLEPYLASFVPGGHPLRPRTAQELASVERAFGASSSVTRNRDGSEDVSHTAAAYIVDDAGRIVDEWPFGIPPVSMTAELRALLERAR